MAFTVSAAKSWQVRVSEGPELRVDYVCPTCKRPSTIHVQAGDWWLPVVPEGEDSTGRRPYANGTTPQVQRWEARRASGAVEHAEVNDFVTQIWCHQCQKGSEVTVSHPKNVTAR